MAIIHQSAVSTRIWTCLIGLALLSGALMSGCASNASSQVAELDDAGLAARAAFVAWSVGRGIQYRELSSALLDVRNGVAIVELRASIRANASRSWEPLLVELPVQADGDGRWLLPELASVDRLVRTAQLATAVSLEGAAGESTPKPTTTTATTNSTPPAAISSATVRPERPPPPEGAVIYESNWSSGLDGWIGTPDWKVADGKLVNDGTRASRDPWIEAPVQVDPWQAMVVEAQIEVLANEFGSFGLVSRAGAAGWFQFGVRWDATEADNGSPMAILGMTAREQTMLTSKEVHAEPRPLQPGPHLYRAEFRDGVATFFIDGHQVGQIAEGAFAPGEFIGLWSERTPLAVHFFRVTLV